MNNEAKKKLSKRKSAISDVKIKLFLLLDKIRVRKRWNTRTN